MNHHCMNHHRINCRRANHRCYRNGMLMVGTTWPEQLRNVSMIVGDKRFLLPGIGAQGGDVEAVFANAKTPMTPDSSLAHLG